MGFSLLGIEPSKKEGEFFYANAWTWQHLLMLLWSADREHLTLTGRVLLDRELLSAMTSNDGDGPDDQETCDGLAAGIETLLHAELLGEADPVQVRLFLQFLYACGGFEVW